MKTAVESKLGLRRVLSKIIQKAKVSAIDFRKDRHNVLLIGGHEEREKAKRKGKAKRDENAGLSDGKDNDTRKKQYPVADKTTNQHLRRIYSAGKKTAAHTLLNLSIAVILANYYTAMELMADQSFPHLFKLLQEKSMKNKTLRVHHCNFLTQLAKFF